MVERFSNEETLAILDGLSEEEYVLHGSASEYPVLKPNLPVQDSTLIPEYQKKAVYGTLLTEIALLYALIQEPRDRWGWYINVEARPYLTVKGPRYMRSGIGFIYICRRQSFPVVVPPGLVCLSTRQVKPVRILRIQPHILEILIKSERLAFQ